MITQQKPIFCIGSINWDKYVLDKHNSSQKLGGSACNTAYFLSELLPKPQYEVYMIGLIGNDSAKNEIMNQLNLKQFNKSLIKETSGNSGRTSICLDKTCEREIERFHSVTEILPQYLKDPKIKHIINHHIIHVKANRETIDAIFNFTNHIFSTDISGFLGNGDAELSNWINQLSKNKSIEILLGNENEFEILLKTINPSIKSFDFPKSHQISKNELLLFRELMQLLRTKLIGLKCGKNGGIIISQNEFICYPVPQTKVIDTTGAGDAFNAGLIASYLLELPLENILKNAVTLGSLNCTVLGAQELKIEKTDYL